MSFFAIYNRKKPHNNEIKQMKLWLIQNLIEMKETPHKLLNKYFKLIQNLLANNNFDKFLFH